MKRSLACSTLVVIVSLSILLSGCTTVKEPPDPRQNPADQIDQEQAAAVNWLDRTAQSFYRTASDGNAQEAREQLQLLESGIRKLRFEGVTSVEGMQALTTVVSDAKRTFNSADFNVDEGFVRAAQVRLAVDALTHKSQPMWHQYYKVMKDDVRGLEKALETPEAVQLRELIVNADNHYRIIRPSVLISKSPTEAETMDSLFKALHTFSTQENSKPEQLKPIVGQLSSEIDRLFGKGTSDKDAFAPVNPPASPFMLISIIGSIIVSVLTYVGYRRYQVERDFVQVKTGRGRQNPWM
ncbi:sporulation protein YpjB [Paenibacillus turpanensis]|uniref:sporulation protein YpjB n=1 Tax=Paenibacillus turpanensis TaxID=2689078 RepID=UPI00140ADDC0|nr:sporulation protein YpjB [Paenibacillus turpanensis]